MTDLLEFEHASPFTGDDLAVLPEQTASLEALCTVFTLLADGDPRAEAQRLSVIPGLRALAAIAQASPSANSETPPTDWHAQRQQIPGVIHILALEVCDGEFTRSLTCDLDAQNRPYRVLYESSGATPCYLSCTLASAEGNWTLGARDVGEARELVLGAIPNFNWAPAPLAITFTEERTAMSLLAGLHGLATPILQDTPNPVTPEPLAPPTPLPDTPRQELESLASATPAAKPPETILWYYAVDQTQHGPVNEERLRQLFQNGTLTMDTLLWTPALTTWQPARDIAPPDALPAAPPPLPATAPPLPETPSPVNWYYARQNQQHGPVSETELRRLLSTGTLPPETLVWHAALPAWQDAVRAGVAPAPPVAAPVPTAWYYSWQGGQMGPVGEEELRRLLATGAIPSTTLVWRAALPGWLDAVTAGVIATPSKGFCGKCGTPIKPGVRFCGKCGTPYA